jgi:glutaredoxin 3
MPAEVTVYTTRLCAYCYLAKRLLKKRSIAFDEVDVSNRDDLRGWLVEKTGRRTVPQIFVRGDPIGGYHELAALDRQGKLAATA